MKLLDYTLLYFIFSVSGLALPVMPGLTRHPEKADRYMHTLGPIFMGMTNEGWKAVILGSLEAAHVTCNPKTDYCLLIPIFCLLTHDSLGRHSLYGDGG